MLAGVLVASPRTIRLPKQRTHACSSAAEKLSFCALRVFYIALAVGSSRAPSAFPPVCFWRLLAAHCGAAQMPEHLVVNVTSALVENIKDTASLVVRNWSGR